MLLLEDTDGLEVNTGLGALEEIILDIRGRGNIGSSQRKDFAAEYQAYWLSIRLFQLSPLRYCGVRSPCSTTPGEFIALARSN